MCPLHIHISLSLEGSWCWGWKESPASIPSIRYLDDREYKPSNAHCTSLSQASTWASESQCAEIVTIAVLQTSQHANTGHSPLQGTSKPQESGADSPFPEELFEARGEMMLPSFFLIRSQHTLCVLLKQFLWSLQRTGAEPGSADLPSWLLRKLRQED